MKKILTIALALLSFSGYAQQKPILDLVVENHSSEIITIKKSDGSVLTVKARQKVSHETFARYSDAASYTNGVLRCSWNKLDDEPDTCLIIAGLIYENPGNCRIFYRQSIPC